MSVEIVTTVDKATGDDTDIVTEKIIIENASIYDMKGILQAIAQIDMKRYEDYSVGMCASRGYELSNGNKLNISFKKNKASWKFYAYNS